MSTADLRDLLVPLPEAAAGLTRWRVLIIVTSINSFTQRVLAYLKGLGFDSISVQLATNDEDILAAAGSFAPHIIICPFLTRRIPESVFGKVSGG